MGFRDIFKLHKWQPDPDRVPPKINEWPDHIITLNNKKFDKFIDTYPLAIVDFWAPWCGPCKTIGPRLRQLSKMYQGKAAFGKVNVDEYKEITQRFHVLGIPNLIFFSYGKKVTNLTGVKPLSKIQSKIDEILVQFEKTD